MKSLVTSASILDMFPGRGAASSPDCRYDFTPERGNYWYCWFKSTRGTWTGGPVEVVRYEAPRLPVWRLTGAAPDV